MFLLILLDANFESKMLLELRSSEQLQPIHAEEQLKEKDKTEEMSQNKTKSLLRANSRWSP
jgi:hypothetical protein